MIKSYLTQYSGISTPCWQRILISFLFSITRGLFFFLSLYFVKDLHMNIATAGLAVSCYGMGAVLGSFIGGKLSDIISSNKVGIISLLLNALILFALANVSHTNMLMIVSFLWAAFAYSFLTANHAWILERTQMNEAERLKVLNVLYAAANLGIFVSAGVVGFSDLYGFKTIFVGSGIVLVIITLWLVYKSCKTQAHTSPSILSLSQGNDANEQQANPNSGNAKVFWLSIVCLFFVSLIVTMKSTVYTIYLHSAFPQFSVKGVSFIFALNPLLVVLFQTPLVNWFRSRNKMWVMGFGGLLMGVGMLILPFSLWFAFAILSAIIYTLGEMIFTVINELAIYQSCKAGKKGQALGVFRLVYALSMIAGPALSGYLYDQLGSNAVWYVSFVIGLLFFVFCYAYRHYYRMPSQ